MENNKQCEPLRHGVTPFPCYHDFSRKDQEWVKKRFTQVQNRSSRGAKATFPQCLYYMLENVERDGYFNVVSFQPHGRSFKIHDRKLFVHDVLPHYFQQQTKISSFARQLNIYGFLRLIKPGPDQDSYYHPYFLRGRPDMCCLIRRNPTAACSARQTYDPSTEPDFYNMLPVQNPNQSPASEKRTDPDVTVSTGNDELYKIVSTTTSDQQQSIGDGGLAFNSKMSVEELQRLAPNNQTRHSDTITISFTDPFSTSGTSANNQDLFNDTLQSGFCSILEPNPITQTYSRQGNTPFTVLDHSRTTQQMAAIIPNKSSNNVTLNYSGKSVNHSDEMYKMQSFLSSSYRKHDNNETIQCMDTLPSTDSACVGTMYDCNTLNYSPNDRSNTTDVLSLRNFDVDFVNQHQRHENQIGTNNYKMSDYDDSSRTSGSGMARFLEDVDLESDNE